MKAIDWVIMLAFLSLYLFSTRSMALSQEQTMIKPRASFMEMADGLYEPLDLKSRLFKFSSKDLDVCGLNLIRKDKTLAYSCTLALPVTAKIAKLRTQKTASTMDIPFAGKTRRVFVDVALDGRAVTYSTKFDTTGFDLEVAKFNDDFYRVYGKTAHLVLAEAMNRQLEFQILEGREALKNLKAQN